MKRFAEKTVPTLRPYILGTGSYHPPKLYGNSWIRNEFDIRKMDGTKASCEFPEKYLGIKTRAMSFDDAGNVMEDDVDLAVKACSRAIEAANVKSNEIGSFIHASPTPRRSHFQQHMADLKEQLKLSDECNLVFLNLGCGSPATAFQLAQGELLRLGNERKVLVATSQSISAVLHSVANTKMRYSKQVSEDSWETLVPRIFGDGSAAVVLHGTEKHEGFVKVVNLNDHRVHIMDKQYGGTEHQIMNALDSSRDTYLNDAKFVADTFVSALMKVNAMLREEREDISYYLIHQANAHLLEQLEHKLRAIDTSSKDPKFPSNIGKLGNTSAASTLMLLDELHRKSLLKPGDKIRTLWIGGGNGHQVGGGTYVVPGERAT